MKAAISYNVELDEPSAALSRPEQALWWLKKGGLAPGREWKIAHSLCQMQEGETAHDLVHALVHWIEGMQATLTIGISGRAKLPPPASKPNGIGLPQNFAPNRQLRAGLRRIAVNDVSPAALARLISGWLLDFNHCVSVVLEHTLILERQFDFTRIKLDNLSCFT